MDHLWSPWRFDYITGAHRMSGCVFCNAITDGSADPLIVFRGRACFVILNLFPYNNGHLLIVPNRHVATLASASAEELSEMIQLARRAELALTAVYSPEGINAGVNLGKPAGAGILDHLHMHVVPRWNGDTSFMPVLGDVKVLPEHLLRTAERLRAHFA